MFTTGRTQLIAAWQKASLFKERLLTQVAQGEPPLSWISSIFGTLWSTFRLTLTEQAPASQVQTLCHLSRSLFTSTGPSRSPIWPISPGRDWPSCPTSFVAVWPATLHQRSWGSQGTLERKIKQHPMNFIHLTAGILISEILKLEVCWDESLSWLWCWACWLTGFDLLGYLTL